MIIYMPNRIWIAVILEGRVVEEGPAEQIVAGPKHPYTRKLLASAPSLSVFS